MRPRRTTSIFLTAWILLTLLLALAGPASALGAPRPRPAPGPILVEWRRDVWLPPDLRIMDESGANQSTLVGNLLRGGRAHWSSDGTRIGGYEKAYGGSGQWDRAIMSIGADGRDERVILTAAQLDAFNVARGLKSAAAKGFGLPFEHADYSPDGQSMVFSGIVRFDGPTTADADDLYRHRIFAVSVDGSAAIRVLTDGVADHDDFHPSWSAARDRIVFVRSAVEALCAACEGLPERIGQQQLWTMAPDGSQLSQLTAFGPGAMPSGTLPGLMDPAWDPSGTRIAVSGNVGGWNNLDADLWLIEVGTAPDGHLTAVASVALLASANGEWSPAWSPIGDRLVFVRASAANSRSSTFEVVLLNVSAGVQSVIASSTKQAILFPDWRH